MKKILTYFLLSLIVFNSDAQDIDFYHVQQDDLLKTPYLAYGMNVEEYQLLSRNLRMKDMMYAMVVPGYVHFKAHENKTGYYLLGMRATSFAAFATVGFQTSAKIKDILNLRFDDALDKTKTPVFIIANSTVIWISISTIMATYFYDWIHGQHLMSKKQELIRYKYNMKFNIEKTPAFSPQNQVYPSMSLQINF